MVGNLLKLNRASYLLCQEACPPFERRAGRYVARFARTPAELDAAAMLRFEVFNLELGEGLAGSFQTGRDWDEFDEHCHHLLVLETETDRVIGTYRMQTGEMAARGKGFYSAGEFDFSGLPSNVLHNAVELGRACIAQAHRNTSVLFLLWQGLAAYLLHNRKRYLFGCCSLTGQDAQEGWRAMELLKEQGHLHPQVLLPPRPGFECTADAKDVAAAPVVKIPRLFRTYLRYGAKVCSPPAIDRQFKTIDFLVLFDVAEMDRELAKLFF
jgi:putative hemolysin